MNGDILLRVELRNPEQARAVLTGQVFPWMAERFKANDELVAEFRLREDAITEEQRGFYHAVVLQEIADFARPNGQQFPMPVWKEWFRKKFVGYKRVSCTDPMTGRKSRRSERKSTEDLGIAGYARLIDQVTAFAATELGVTISQPLPAHLRPQRKRQQAIEQGRIDADTGELLEATV